MVGLSFPSQTQKEACRIRRSVAERRRSESFFYRLFAKISYRLPALEVAETART